MPRKPRFFLPDVPVHIVHRGHSREPVFFEDQDYATYAHWVREGSRRYGIAVHAFVLMTNHVHLLVTPKEAQGVSRLMQYVGRRYVPYINYKYGKSGTLWEGRFKASLVQAETYLMSTMRYIEMNPVRANMVESPGHYRWSSFVHNAGVREIGFVRFHPLYMALGENALERVQAYRALFRSHLDSETMKNITEAWLSGTPLGNDYFREKVEMTLLRKVGQTKRGRPRNQDTGKGL